MRHSGGLMLLGRKTPATILVNRDAKHFKWAPHVTKVQAKPLHKSNKNVLKRTLHIGIPELKLRVAHLSWAAVQMAAATLAITIRDIILAVCGLALAAYGR
jgi:hypothetical protein